MLQVCNDESRYFIEIDLSSLKIIRCGFTQNKIWIKAIKTANHYHPTLPTLLFII